MLALLLGLLLSALMVAGAVDDVIDTEAELFTLEMEAVKDRLVRNLNAVEESVDSMRIVFNASREVEPGEFHVLGADVLRKHDYIGAALYLPRVEFEDRPAFERARRDGGYTAFGIKDYRDGGYVPADERSRYLPVVYHEPFTPLTARQLGLDLLSIDSLAPYLLAAVDTGANTATTAAATGNGRDDYFVFRAATASASATSSSTRTTLRRRRASP